MMGTVIKEWDILTMVEQARVVVLVLQAGQFTSTRSSKTVLEFPRSQERQRRQQHQYPQD